MFGHTVYLRLGELTDASISGLVKEAIELVNCSYSMARGADDKGKVQTRVYGGVINATLPGLPSDAIVKWALTNWKYMDGVLVICDPNNMPLEKIYFRNAACIGMEIESSQFGQNYITTKLTLSAKELQVGALTLINDWK